MPFAAENDTFGEAAHGVAPDPRTGGTFDPGTLSDCAFGIAHHELCLLQDEMHLDFTVVKTRAGRLSTAVFIAKYSWVHRCLSHLKEGFLMSQKGTLSFYLKVAFLSFSGAWCSKSLFFSQ